MRGAPDAPTPAPGAERTHWGRSARASRIRDLQCRFDREADPATRTWFEDYLKQAIRYRGLKTPAVSRLVAKWRTDNGLEFWPPEAELDLATDLIRQRKCEDKLAGIICIQKHAFHRLSEQMLLDAIEELFAAGTIWEWSTNDSLCGRVLGPVVRRSGMPAATRIAGWRSGANLWQRRSSAVSLRAVAAQKEFHPVIALVVAHLVQERERFIQTGVGWLIADLSRHAPEFATGLVEKHFDDLSGEVVRRHLKYLPDYGRYRARKRR